MSNRSRLALLSLLIWTLVPLAAAQVYTITDLGTVSPTAINTWGQVVGVLNNHAVIWPLHDLGVLPGGTYSLPSDINDLDEVVGSADGPITNDCDGLSDFVETFAFRWTPSHGMQNLGTLARGEYPACVFSSYAYGINAFGNVVGVLGNPSTTYIDGFLWTATGGMTYSYPDPTIYFYQSHANAINNLDQIVGSEGLEQDHLYPGPPNGDDLYVDYDEHYEAILWKNGTAIFLGTLDPEGSGESEAMGINDLAQVVGWSAYSGPTAYHAFLWTQNGGMQDLGTLPGDTNSVAYKINYFGQVIGLSGSRPFLWTSRNGMRDLNSLIPPKSGWVLSTATGINIWGQVVGQGVLKGQVRGFLLTP